MEAKPKSVKLVNFEEELLPSGRKLLHCVFQNRYGSGFQYKWTAPWRDKEGEYGVERLFFKCLGTEEWNDYDSVWSEELRKVAKEVPSLEEIALPVKVEISGVTEHFTIDEEGVHEYLKIHVDVLTDEETVRKDRVYGKEYIRVGSVNMAWESLSFDLLLSKELAASSEIIEEVVNASGHVKGVSFWVSVKKMEDKGEYQIISRKIASCIRHFIRDRLSEYKAIKKGFEEQR
jgi:hypothetical protein